MTVTIDGITYEGTPDEIRIIVENPPVINRRPKEWGDKNTDDGEYPWTPVIPNDPWKTPRFDLITDRAQENLCSENVKAAFCMRPALPDWPE